MLVGRQAGEDRNAVCVDSLDADQHIGDQCEQTKEQGPEDPESTNDLVVTARHTVGEDVLGEPLIDRWGHCLAHRYGCRRGVGLDFSDCHAKCSS